MYQKKLKLLNWIYTAKWKEKQQRILSLEGQWSIWNIHVWKEWVSEYKKKKNLCFKQAAVSDDDDDGKKEDEGVS